MRDRGALPIGLVAQKAARRRPGDVGGALQVEFGLGVGELPSTIAQNQSRCDLIRRDARHTRRLWQCGSRRSDGTGTKKKQRTGRVIENICSPPSLPYEGQAFS